jgi:serine/threonine protein phosphatase 1
MQHVKFDAVKRILAIGDIHGCSVAFDALLEVVNPGTDDLVITLGDYIDRGPDSNKVLERLIKLHETIPIVSLSGNHEEMVLEWRKNNYDATLTWWANGGLATLKSYCQGDEGWLIEMFWKSFSPIQAGEHHAAACELIPQSHWELIENCNYWFETKDWIFVHGQLDPDLGLAEQSLYNLHWARFHKSQRPHKSGKKVICAHTPQVNGLPIDIGHAVCIDTYLYGGQWLTCLDVRGGKYYQANALGETRIKIMGPGSGFIY